MIFEKAHELTQQGISFVMITITKIKGSAPQDLGAKCLVSLQGLEAGTIGGGKVEAHAIELAQKNLKSSQVSAHFEAWNLQTDIGMTCGGEVTFFFEYFPAQTWPIVIFGAGHVAQALSTILAHLSCQLTCIDPRPQWIDKLDKKVKGICHPHPEKLVAELCDQSYIICMTQGHSSDVPVLLEVAKNFPHIPYVGAIGSKTKALRIKQELKDKGVSEEFLTKLHIPIGLPLGNNNPFEIAISISAQLLQLRDSD